MNTPPRKESETGLYAPVWKKINQLIDYVREISVVHGRNVRLTRTMNGTLLTGEAVAESGGAEVQQLRLKSIENDFYTCRSWNGTTEGSTDIYVARPFQHRVTNFDGQSIAYSSDGDAFTATFAYTSTTKRTKTISGTAETQVLIPYFKTDFDLIYAIDVGQTITIRSGAGYATLTDPNDAPITLIDLNVDGRAWAKLE